MAARKKSLIVEGWRFLPHSYAVINQWQLLSLIARDDVAVRVRDLPFYRARWQSVDGLFERPAEEALKSIPAAAPHDTADVTLRISFPYDFTAARAGVTAVFGTSEFQCLPRSYLAAAPDFAAWRGEPHLKIITPSRWSAQGFCKAGFSPAQVFVVPHGVDATTFRPLRDARDEIRARHSLAPHDFVFLSAGGMTENKGIDLLLAAFAEILRRFPHARLVLKGLNPLYRSETYAVKNLQLLPESDRQRVFDASRYIGDALSNRDMALLYQAADAYVAPYRGEGFGLPVLEAAACGVPIICTRGGSTDDFVTDAFARRIDSAPRAYPYDDVIATCLEPSLDHLISLMAGMIEDDGWRRQAAAAGPAHVRERHNWDKVTDHLLAALWNGAPHAEPAPVMLSPAQAMERASAAYAAGQLGEAEKFCSAILAAKPDHVDANHLLAIVQSRTGRREEALLGYDRALARDPGNAAALGNRGNVLHELGREEEALASYEEALRRDAGSAETFVNRAIALNALQRVEEAVASYDQAIALRPDHAEAHFARGNRLLELNRTAEALASYEATTTLRPDHAAAWSKRGHALLELKQFEQALAMSDKALAIKGDLIEALNDRGNVLLELKRAEEALASYDALLAIRPDLAEAHNNRGNALMELKRLAEAVAAYDKAIALKADFADACHNRGKALKELNRLVESLASYRQAVAIRPDHRHAFSEILDCGIKLCDWSAREADTAEMRRHVAAGTSIISPFVVLGLCDDPGLLLPCAASYARNKLGVPPERLWNGSTWRNDRIKVAYISPDFKFHPVALLTAGLFELHDRSRFEVLGISLGPDDGSAIRARIAAACDRFYDMRAQGDERLARLLHELRADILVDLAGHTLGSPLRALARRSAPIQASYLGYPATMGVDCIDYIIADPLALPFDQQAFYPEQIVHLPHCYLVTDDKRTIADRVPTRGEAGLPPEAFVFCCFNNNWKIAPAVFEVWMRLLRAVEGSVLWLSQAPAEAVANLRREASARGVDPERLIFAPKVPRIEDHLARHVLADLFLDTLPYNAHTTAADALWTGLPVLTCLGRSFAGRVAASLLQAVGLPELVTEDLAEYEALALRLATDPALLRDFRTRLERNRATHPLFDTDRFRRHIEAAYTRMWETWQRGEPPQSFAVAPLDPSNDKAPPPALPARPAEKRLPLPAAMQQASDAYEAGRLAEAAQLCRAILKAKADHFDANHLLALVETRLGNTEAALASYERALALKPDDANANWNHALCLLLAGDFARGLEKYELRWQSGLRERRRDFAQPLWLGEESIAGKTILIHAEQGFGDTIQFCRYAPLVAARGAKVILEVQPPLRRLVSNMPGLHQILTRDEALPAFDLHCPLMSLPLAFATRIDSIPAGVPYLDAGADLVEAWSKRLARTLASGHLRIGLAWSGKSRFHPDQNRAVALDQLGPLLALPDVQFISLQKEVRETDLPAMAAAPNLIDLRSEHRDFCETAAMISALDLVICVDTAVAHLAGALGKPTFLMLPFAADWRWLREREDSPWYPTMRLFRQTKPGQWSDVVERMAEAAAAVAATQAAASSHRRGNTLAAQRRFEDALACYTQAIALKPDFVEAYNNQGIALWELGRSAEAVASFDHAIARKPDFAKAYFNRGNALVKLKRFAEALASYRQTLAHDPGHRFALGGWADCALQLCDWGEQDAVRRQVYRHVAERRSVVYPFVLLGYSDDPALQLQCAQTFVQDRIAAARTPPLRTRPSPAKKIRLAYISGDFRRHATAYLMAELFERHDRSKFELIGVSFGTDDKSEIRARLAKAFDQFHDVGNRTDAQAAQLIRDLHVHIAVDLKGHTGGARIGILAARGAPIQVSYLGYPGTTGADFIDYVLADRLVLPLDQQPFYTEKIVHLPDCYQVNDRKRPIAEPPPTRQDASLPPEGFVFCCFNGSWKITPALFNIWMSLLRKIDGSVLWLLADNEMAAANLRAQASARGIDPARLVFAARIGLAQHLARHRLADLFLDTLSVNAHTTASDALWAGLPVLTCRGQSFAGRVAASLNKAVGLPELVTDSLAQYEALALRLATDAALLRGFRERLARNRATAPLFDTDRFRRHIEAAYTRMWEIWRSGGLPRSFAVAPLDEAE